MDHRLPQGSIPEMRETGRSFVTGLESSLKSTSRDEGQFSRSDYFLLFLVQFPGSFRYCTLEMLHLTTLPPTQT